MASKRCPRRGRGMIGQPLDIRRALTEKPEPIDYVLPSLPARCLGALVAPGGVGKSSLVTQISVEMALGLALVGGVHAARAPAKVVLLLAEEDVQLCVWRLQALKHLLETERDKIDDERLALLESNLQIFPLAGSDVSVLTSRRATKVADQIKRVAEGSRLLVVDPLRRFYDGDENDSSTVTAVVQTFERICRDTGTTIVMTQHTTKSSVLDGRGDLQQASRGSSALPDGVRWQANLVPTDGSGTTTASRPSGPKTRNFHLFIPKANYAPPTEPVELRRVESGLFQPTYSAPSVSKSRGGGRG